MMNRENTTSIPAYYDVVTEKGKTMYLSKLTMNSEMTVPSNPRGGMLLDEMGLGKTLQVTNDTLHSLLSAYHNYSNATNAPYLPTL